MSTYENALHQLDELIAQQRSQQSAQCAQAEEQDMLAVRLQTLRRVLSANDQATIDKIDLYYQKYLKK